jgi:hypothetical protein
VSLDYKLFVPGIPLQPGTLWINEQVPGYTRSEDVTGVLLRNGGYWPSYNVPCMLPVTDTTLFL